MKRKICSVLPSIALEHPCADANAPRASGANQKLQMADDRVRRIRLDGEEARAAAVNEAQILAVARAAQMAAVLLAVDAQDARHTLVADIAPADHMRRAEIATRGGEPIHIRGERKPHHRAEHAVEQRVHILVALIAEHREAVALAQQKTALARYAVQPARVFADDVPANSRLFSPMHIVIRWESG